MRNKGLSIGQIFKSFVYVFMQAIEAKKTDELDIDKWRDGVWTTLVKETFCEMGKNNFKVYSSAHEGEYLLDLIWEKQDGETGGLRLGLESEWGDIKEVEEDFYKLMYTKCALKVLIYSSSSDSKTQEFLGRFKEILLWYDKHLEGEQYLFIDITEFEPYKIVGHSFAVTKDFLANKNTIQINKLEEYHWSDISKNYVAKEELVRK
ncbi:MAG: hypothetical protein JRI96_10120 [Deltaproteobacteria bacterium]|nr:hypothetical protein [Deltaproteobacteria bacterium]